nr:MAG: hypothetical protein [Apis mellifera filamentous virus]
MLSRKRNRESRSRLRQDGRDRLVHQLNVRNRRRILDNLGHISTRLNTLQHVSTISPPYLDHISTISRPYLDNTSIIFISSTFRPYFDHISTYLTISQLYIDQISTGSRPDLDRISTIFRPCSDGRVSIVSVGSRSPGSCLARRDFSTVSRASRTPRSRSSVKRLIGVSLSFSFAARTIDRLVGRSFCSVDIVARRTHVARTIALTTSSSRHRAGLNRELSRELALLVRPARFIAQFSV